jgi:hypothetical protein
MVDADLVELLQDYDRLREALTEVREMAGRFDTFGDPGRTRTFISDITQLADRALPKETR